MGQPCSTSIRDQVRRRPPVRADGQNRLNSTSFHHDEVESDLILMKYHVFPPRLIYIVTPRSRPPEPSVPWGTFEFLLSERLSIVSGTTADLACDGTASDSRKPIGLRALELPGEPTADRPLTTRLERTMGIAEPVVELSSRHLSTFQWCDM